MKRIQAAFTKLLALGLLVAPFMSTVGRDAVRVSASEAREIKPAFLLPTYFAPAAPSVRATADVLLIDDDLSNGFRSAECHDYRSIYTQALTAAGLSYSIFETTSTTPDPGTSPRPHFVNFEGASIYRLVIYFSGDSHCGQELGWNVPQMRAYLNGGGRMIVFSQDALYFDKANEDAALSVPTTFSPTLYFGASYITDTIAVAAVQGSGSFSYTTGITHTIGVTATSIDRAGLAVVSGADPAVILSKSADPTQIVGTRMSSDPSIESDLGLFVRQDMAYRTQLVTYGLEDITNVNDRAKLLDMLAGYELDRLTVSFNSPVFDANNNHDGTTTISATATSNITHTATGFSNVIVKYRWDFGDNSYSLLANPQHEYAQSGYYTVYLVSYNPNNCSDTSNNTINLTYPSMDIAVVEAHSTIENDKIVFSANLTNPGTRTITELNLIAQVDNGIALNEKWTGALEPSETIEYLFSSSLQVYQSQNLNYYCISAEIPGFSPDIHPSNNQVCNTFHKNFLVIDPYPSPTNGLLNIDFLLPEKGNVTIELYDSKGTYVHEIYSGSGLEGFNKVLLSTVNLNRGVYAYKLSYNGNVEVKRFIK